MAVLPARGVQCCPLPLSLFPAPTIFPGVSMTDLSREMGRILNEVKGLGVRFDAIYSGYLANAGQAGLVKAAYEAFPDAFRVVDPAMADNGKLYRSIDPALVGAMKELAGGAHLITPNVTEAAILLGKPPESAPSDESEALEWVKALSENGRSVVLTGGGGDGITVGWSGKDGFGVFWTPRFGGSFPGSGDIFASYLLSELLHASPLGEAVQAAARFVGECAAETVRRGAEPREGLLFETVLRRG
jgi:pyridoxine kinase